MVVVLQSDLDKMIDTIDKYCIKMCDDYPDGDMCDYCKLDSMCEKVVGDFSKNIGYCLKANHIALEELGLLDKPTHDNVNYPKHYTSGGIECIDAMVSAFGKEVVKHFCLCNAFKYTFRCENKNGLEDIQKAKWYLNKFEELSSE